MSHALWAVVCLTLEQGEVCVEHPGPLFPTLEACMAATELEIRPLAEGLMMRGVVFNSLTLVCQETTLPDVDSALLG